MQEFNEIEFIQQYPLHSDQNSKGPSVYYSIEEKYIVSVWFFGFKSIPEELKYCKAIRTLCIFAESNFEINRNIDLPNWIGDLDTIQEIVFDGLIINSFPLWLNRLPQLTTLKFLNIIQLNLSPHELKSPTLNELEICANLIELPNWICKLNNLHILNLNNNFLTDLPEGLINLTNLAELYIANNHFYKIPSWIGKIPNLFVFDISCNPIQSLNNQIDILYKLYDFKCNGTHIREFPSFLQYCPNLESLELSHNQIAKIPSYIYKFSNLTNLDLQYNQISIIPSEIGLIPKLLEINLSGNPISSNIPLEFANLKTLGSISLNSCGLTEFPTILQEMSHLCSISLTDNLISEIPQWIDIFKNLRRLDLALDTKVNPLKIIPESILNLNRLIKFNLPCPIFRIKTPECESLIDLQEIRLRIYFGTCNTKELLFHKAQWQNWSVQGLIDRLTQDQPLFLVDLYSNKILAHLQEIIAKCRHLQTITWLIFRCWYFTMRNTRQDFIFNRDPMINIETMLQKKIIAEIDSSNLDTRY